MQRRSKPKGSNPVEQLRHTRGAHPLKSVVEKINISKVKPIDQFTGELIKILISDLAVLRSVSAPRFADLICRLHALAEWVAGARDYAEFERQSVSLTRPARLKWGQSKAHLKNAQTSLARAKSSLPESEKNQLKRAYLNFAGADMRPSRVNAGYRRVCLRSIFRTRPRY
jgi:hypothetical protein